MKIDYPATIIKVRATLNLSQVELAEMLDVSFASVNRWENGKYEPTRLVKEKIRLICKQPVLKRQRVTYQLLNKAQPRLYGR